MIDLKQRLGRGDVFLYGIAVDSPNDALGTRINPQVFRELSAQSGGYAEIVWIHRGHRAGHFAHRRGTERAVHDRLHADDSR